MLLARISIRRPRLAPLARLSACHEPPRAWRETLGLGEVDEDELLHGTGAWLLDTSANASSARWTKRISAAGRRWLDCRRCIVTAEMDEADRGAAGAVNSGLYPAELAAWQQDAMQSVYGELRAIRDGCRRRHGVGGGSRTRRSDDAGVARSRHWPKRRVQLEHVVLVKTTRGVISHKDAAPRMITSGRPGWILRCVTPRSRRCWRTSAACSRRCASGAAWPSVTAREFRWKVDGVTRRRSSTGQRMRQLFRNRTRRLRAIGHGFIEVVNEPSFVAIA